MQSGREEKASILLRRLFFVFFKIGAFTFGGGYAMLPLIEKEVVENQHWISDEEILDIVAISQSTPGPLAINAATFIGYRVAGAAGSVLATLGSVLPSLVIISIISYFFTQFRENMWVSYAFLGIRAGVVALMVNAMIKLSKGLKKDAFNISVVCVAAVLVGVLELNAIYVLIAAAAVGLLWSFRLLKKTKGPLK